VLVSSPMAPSTALDQEVLPNLSYLISMRPQILRPPAFRVTIFPDHRQMSPGRRSPFRPPLQARVSTERATILPEDREGSPFQGEEGARRLRPILPRQERRFQPYTTLERSQVHPELPVHIPMRVRGYPSPSTTPDRGTPDSIDAPRN